SLIAIGLWLLMAWANRGGKSWGRIMASVLFGLNTVLLLLGFTRAAAWLSLAFSVLVWLVGLGAIVLLLRKEASQYVAPMSPRPGAGLARGRQPVPRISAWQATAAAATTFSESTPSAIACGLIGMQTLSSASCSQREDRPSPSEPSMSATRPPDR